MADTEKRYKATITMNVIVEGENAPKMFDSEITYHNMKYEDVVLVEGAVIQMLAGLNKFAETKKA